MEEKVHLEVPDFMDKEQAELFHVSLRDNAHVFGVKGLQKLVPLYEKHLTIGKRQLAVIQNKVARINGEKTSGPIHGGQMRSLKNTAVKFYEGLNTKALRMHAELAGIVWAEHETVEETINALVDAYVQEVQGS